LALKLHPDKRPEDERARAEKEFDEARTAYEALRDVDAKRALDDVLRATATRRAMKDAIGGKRKRAIEELERREGAAKGGDAWATSERAARERLRAELERLKTQRERESKRTAGDGDRDVWGESRASASADVPEHMYRSLKAVWRRDDDDAASTYSAKRLREIFETFGAVEDVVLREGKKKKGSALVVFASREACVAASRAASGDWSNPLVVARAAIPPASSVELAAAAKEAAPSEKSARPSAANKDFESLVLERMKRAQERARLVAEADADA